MQPFVCSSNPMSPLNCARREYYSARIRLGMASDKSSAMTALNKARAKLHAMIYGKTEKISPDFEMRVRGIPVGVKITGYDDEEIDFMLVDRKGYRARWLEDKCTDSDTCIIEYRIAQWVEQS